MRRFAPGFALRTLVLALAIVPCVLALGARAEARQPGSPEHYVKYYVVQETDKEEPERLPDIAARLLGSIERSEELFALNVDRTQPDGERLTDPDKLHKGWVLVLPWDAVGEGVIYGALPEDPAGSESERSRMSGGCTAAARGELVAPPWPHLRLAPDQAWPLSRGAGITVALIGSRPPGDSPALAGRVAPAVEVAAAKDGDDCPGRETAMAGIIAAKPTSGGKMVGIAPKATILPVVTDLAPDVVEPADIAEAVTAAVKAGANVVAVPVPVDLADKAVRAAVVRAVSRGAVVLVPAATSGEPAPRVPGALRVAAIGADDQPLADYVPGGADVLAPGRHVASLAANGVDVADRSGTDVAVAYVAGLAALVRAAAPELSPDAVAEAIESTAERDTPKRERSTGVINPEAAVKATVTDPGVPGAERTEDADDFSSALIIALLAVVSLTALLRLRGPSGRAGRRRTRPEERLEPEPGQMTGDR